ncbi:MAG: response regulator, partial [Opitutaceae bacterium]|nr:response regulator [Opitutaceae bacterium]
MKILIIEDELDIRETLRDLLELNGHTVAVAIDGPMGISMAAEHPDLILCDIGMPGMNGYQVIAAIKALPACQEIPFIFLTAWADREHQRQGMTLGADDYITKPFTQRDVIDAIAARTQRLQPLRERILALLADRRVVAEANWANELLPPFNGIMGGLEMIEEAAHEIEPDELKELLKIIRANAHQQFALSRKLALHYELERRKAPPCPETGRCAASES